MQIFNVVILIVVIEALFGDKIDMVSKEINIFINYLPVIIVLIYYLKYFKFFFLLNKIFKNIKKGNMQHAEIFIKEAEEKGITKIKDEIILYLFAVSNMRIGNFVISNKILESINRKFLTKNFKSKIDTMRCINFYFCGDKIEFIKSKMEEIEKRSSTYYLLTAILVKKENVDNIKSDFFQDKYGKFFESYLKVLFYKETGKIEDANKSYNELLKNNLYKSWVLKLKKI